MQSARIFRNEKSLGMLRLGRLPTLPGPGQVFYRVVTINDKKSWSWMAYQKINALTRRDLLHNQPAYTSTLKNFRLAIKKIFLKYLLTGYEELGRKA
jgi:hypothetical protein